MLQNVIASALDMASSSLHTIDISSSVCDALLQFLLTQVEASEEYVSEFSFCILFPVDFFMPNQIALKHCLVYKIYLHL